MGFRLCDKRAGANDFVAREQAGFEDDFDDAIFGGFDHVPDFAHDVVVLAILEAPDIHDHVDFGGAEIDGGLGFVAFGIGVHRTERVFGTFSRSVRLPKPVNEAKVKAAYKDGILTVSLPIAEIAKPKQIEVKVN